MRLTAKIVGCVLALLLLLLAVDGYFSMKREIALFEADMRRDAVRVGYAIRDTFSDTWQAEGRGAAKRFLEKTTLAEDNLRIRWVWVGGAGDADATPLVPLDNLVPVLEGREVSIPFYPEDGASLLLTYVSVSVPGEAAGAFEIAEPRTELDAYVRESLLRRTTLAMILILMSTVLLVALGVSLIGRPLQKLIARTREIGKGEISGVISLPRHDEFSVLAHAINEMSNNLLEAQDAIHHATQGEIKALEKLSHGERLATIGRLSSGIAHELGTPLNVISGRAKLVFEEDLSREKIKENARIIADQTDRMTRIIRQLLDFARQRTPQRAHIAFGSAVRQVVDLLQPLLSRRHITPLLSNIDDYAIAFVDPTQLQQIVTNFTMNAIDAMPEGGTLEISTFQERVASPSDPENRRSCVCLFVRDEGEGIRAEDMDQIFEPFFTRKIGKGTGLGLSITKEIVEEHDGWIVVTSDVGKGSTFSVYLPTEEPS